MNNYPLIPVSSLSEGRRLVCLVRQLLGELGLSPPQMIVGDYPHQIMVCGSDHVARATFHGLLRFIMNRPTSITLKDGEILEGEILYGLPENDALCFHDHELGRLEVSLNSIVDIFLVDFFCEECHGRHQTADCPHLQIELGEKLSAELPKEFWGV